MESFAQGKGNFTYKSIMPLDSDGVVESLGERFSITGDSPNIVVDESPLSQLKSGISRIEAIQDREEFRPAKVKERFAPALETFEFRRVERIKFSAVGLTEAQCKCLEFAPVLTKTHLNPLEENYKLFDPQLTPAQEATQKLLRLLSSKFALSMDERALIDPERIPSLTIHAAYHMVHPKDPSKYAVQTLVSFQEPANDTTDNGATRFILPQWNSVPSSALLDSPFDESRDHVIRSSKFAGLVITSEIVSGANIIASPRSSKDKALLKPIMTELHAERSVIRGEAETLASYGQGGHFDPIARATVAKGIAQRLNRSVDSLEELGIFPSMFEFKLMERGNKLDAQKEDPTAADRYHFRTRFLGGSAEVQFCWNPESWAFSWNLFAIKVKPEELT